MSEQAKIASLQEKIKEQRNSARTMSIARLVTVVLMMWGFSTYLGWNGGLPSLLLGITMTIFSVLLSMGEWGANRLKKQYMEELDRLGRKIQTCPKCGKQLPQGNYGFCPFCGSPLAPPPP